MVGQTGDATGPRTTKAILPCRHRPLLSAPFHIMAPGFEAGFPAFLSTLDAGDRISAGRVGEVDWIKNRIANLSGSVSDCLLASGIYPQSAFSAETNESKKCADNCRHLESHLSGRDRSGCERSNNLPRSTILLCV